MAVVQINNPESTIWVCDSEAEAEEYRLFLDFDEDYQKDGKTILIIYNEKKEE